ncbi:transporter substrate-binding domain-containing protein [Paucibacter sp. B2R-40]|uniref:substrate-binding periplasmic protein n=1 Tax=Paucibacter sp. B2R-40 TaxID=2893554 RepID=UPI0021E37AC7|nr:transporter substrate-binding domain-containing protein [Paucibacter sp. B2R-40]MCV2353507.1 transporter substrate-binding domain-containing protein [Paucibacter sp. B2R-40]
MHGLAMYVASFLVAMGLGLGASSAAAADLVLIVDASTEMPWAQLQRNQVLAGLHWDLGQALAKQLGRDLRFLVLPRKRIARALEAGDGDLVCGLLPKWFAGPFDWSLPVLPDGELILSLASATAPKAISELRGKPLGTVSGFVYPELEQTLGEGFVREDAPNAAANLRKLNLGRMQYAVSNQLYVDYQRHQGALKVALNPDFMLASYVMPCALSRRSQIKLDALNQAITQLERSGALHQMSSAYR